MGTKEELQRLLDQFATAALQALISKLPMIDVKDEFEKQKEEMYLRLGWYESEEQHQSDFDNIFMKREITHWQPLPTPPSNNNLNQTK